MEKNYREELLGLAAEYCRATGKSQATLGNYIVKDAGFFKRLRKGAGCTVDTYLLVKDWLHANTPKEEVKRAH